MVGQPKALAAPREAAGRYAAHKAAVDRTAPAITDAAYRAGKSKIDAGEFQP